MCVHVRPIARITTATAAMPTTVAVSPTLEPHSVISSNVASGGRRTNGRPRRPTVRPARRGQDLRQNEPERTRIVVITT